MLEAPVLGFRTVSSAKADLTPPPPPRARLFIINDAAVMNAINNYYGSCYVACQAVVHGLGYPLLIECLFVSVLLLSLLLARLVGREEALFACLCPLNNKGAPHNRSVRYGQSDKKRSALRFRVRAAIAVPKSKRGGSRSYYV